MSRAARSRQGRGRRGLSLCASEEPHHDSTMQSLRIRAGLCWWIHPRRIPAARRRQAGAAERLRDHRGRWLLLAPRMGQHERDLCAEPNDLPPGATLSRRRGDDVLRDYDHRWIHGDDHDSPRRRAGTLRIDWRRRHLRNADRRPEYPRQPARTPQPGQ